MLPKLISDNSVFQSIAVSTENNYERICKNGLLDKIEEKNIKKYYLSEEEIQRRDDINYSFAFKVDNQENINQIMTEVVNPIREIIGLNHYFIDKSNLHVSILPHYIKSNSPLALQNWRFTDQESASEDTIKTAAKNIGDNIFTKYNGWSIIFNKVIVSTNAVLLVAANNPAYKQFNAIRRDIIMMGIENGFYSKDREKLVNFYPNIDYISLVKFLPRAEAKTDLEKIVPAETRKKIINISIPEIKIEFNNIHLLSIHETVLMGNKRSYDWDGEGSVFKWVSKNNGNFKND